MKASILKGPKHFEIVDIILPDLKENEVLVKIDCVGICGTDVSVYRGIYKAKDNVILGHEFNGTVADVGKNVKRVSIDDHVVAQASWGCGKCTWCNTGLTSYCESPNMLGRTVDGSLSEYIIVPEHILLKISGEVTSIEAQATVGVATALRALDRANLKIGDKVLLIGPGYSAMIMLQLCKLAGADTVAMVGTRDDRLATAKDLGADLVYNIKTIPDWEDELSAKIVGMGFDIVIEASGTVQGLLSAVRMVKKGGRIIQFGTSFNNIDGLPQKEFYSKEISLIGTKGGFGFYPKAVSLIEKKKLSIDPLITHTFSLDDISSAFNVMDQRLDSVMRVAVFCNKE